MKNLPASFRDPSGHLFHLNGELYRSVQPSYADNYEHLMSSGLYESLLDKLLIVRHEEVELDVNAYKTLKPELIPYISYPYEWSFSQLKDAALLTLRVNKEAMKFGMNLKDASAYNVQFLRGKPVPESVYLNKRFLELVFKYDNPIRPSDINPQWSTNKTSISILSMRIDPASD